MTFPVALLAVLASDRDVGRVRCTLRTSDGAARRADDVGLLIGRADDCDIVVPDETASRRHALVRVDAEGAELVPLGRTPVLYNGTSCDRRQRLVHGDTIRVGSVELVVELEVAAVAPARYLVAMRGTTYRIRSSPFSIGGGADDALVVPTWSPGAVVVHVVDDELFVEPRVPVTCGAETLPIDELFALAASSVIEVAGVPLAFVRGTEGARTTVASPDALPVPHRIVVEMLPRGGRVVFSMPAEDHCVYLADKRLDLIAALLRPPKGYAAGDYIPDDVLRPIVWPGNPGVSRSEINVHLTRCRRDLVSAGLPGPRLIQRAPTGGATRLAIAPGCEVSFL